MAEKKPIIRKARRKKRSREHMMLWAIVILAIVAALMLWGPFRTARRTAGPKPPVKAGKQQPEAPQEIAAVVAIVIDDLGQDLKPAKELLALPDRVTLAVLPGLPHSKEIAQLAHKQGREVLVHLPMEAKVPTERRPSPGMLRSDMTPMEFLAAVNDDLDSVPGAAGVNNHEGSALTENREAMTFLMSELKTRGLFFLDSLTTPKSTAYAVAKEFGLQAARRDVFLDNDSDKPSSIRQQFAELARIARERGRAIGIGHPHPSTLAELEHWLPLAAEQGIEIVPVSRLMQ
jgi:polysaccharide deacetylase 2 family uncharacterized protein YibQ